ncbi:NADPH cytochrome P450 oxidoreductase family protein [Novosphingobium mangrovi (ex Hu et al. 2023)]|uniref:NADPH cytochrome P450 oxidoreductase family protein n=1 Tax=Novosphingobium mangrovi (ex Hu et al. 2023) TaxID=2930094 RepID=A0ABT0A7D2_9SPHN|nr:NADPH cytochrome P450 oxidoreductase family protein [Novosphingobium mangrovi (ex Hu et al. 2023)]MCJ1959092.1 NADPH cytochrome P450 oxidoreductase family protein [Novosphingobium mangrovi (ex Hu et al. 2023)]
MRDTPTDWLIVAVLIAAWLGLTWLCLRKRPRVAVGGASHLIVYASQTGHAQEMAEATHAAVLRAAPDARLVCANRLDLADLAGADRIFFVVSTSGEGDAPDDAGDLDRDLAEGDVDLTGVQVAILALGDRRYTHFCAFGERLKTWCVAMAAEVTAYVAVDDLAPDDLAQWDAVLVQEGVGAMASDGLASAPREWRIASRVCVAGAVGEDASTGASEGLFRLALRPEEGRLPEWGVGDLFELHTPDGHQRDYSIANRCAGEELVLFVRRVIDKGVPGRGSGLLTSLPVGTGRVRARIRAHAGFRPPLGTGPLLAIGAGSGWAGLRPHLLEAMAAGRPCWLIFGERGEVDAAGLLGEMRAWHQEGRFHRLDLALSRQDGVRVPDILAAKSADLCDFLTPDGAVVLCGRLAMGEAALAVLRASMSEAWLENARHSGRLRSDLY